MKKTDSGKRRTKNNLNRLEEKLSHLTVTMEEMIIKDIDTTNQKIKNIKGELHKLKREMNGTVRMSDPNYKTKKIKNINDGLKNLDSKLDMLGNSDEELIEEELFSLELV